MLHESARVIGDDDDDDERLKVLSLSQTQTQPASMQSQKLFNFGGLGIYSTTNPKVVRGMTSWKVAKVGVDRRRAVELALRKEEEQLLDEPLRSNHVWMRQRSAIEGPTKGVGFEWVRVEMKLFNGGTVELLQTTPKPRKLLITLQKCSAEARNPKIESDVDNKVQSMTFNFGYDEIRYDDARLHAGLLRPESAHKYFHTTRNLPEAEFALMPRAHGALKSIAVEDKSSDEMLSRELKMWSISPMIISLSLFVCTVVP